MVMVDKKRNPCLSNYIPANIVLVYISGKNNVLVMAIINYIYIYVYKQ